MPLTSLSLRVVIDGPLLEAWGTHVCHNDHTTNLWANFTFFIPCGAVLLDVEALVGQRLLKASSLLGDPSRETPFPANDDHGGFQVKEIASGLHMVVLTPSIAPGETAELRFHFVSLLEWQGDTLQVHLPPSIDSLRLSGGVLHERRPGPEPLANLEIEVRGSLATSRVSSPTHHFERFDKPDRLLLRPSSGVMAMDRDMIIRLRHPQLDHGMVMVDRDERHWVVLASFRVHDVPELWKKGDSVGKPLFPLFGKGFGAQPERGQSLAVVIGCSSAAEGEPLDRARVALELIFDLLTPMDRFAMISFGYWPKQFPPDMLPASPANLSAAIERTRTHDAKPGGANLAQALDEAFALSCDAIILISDGVIEEHLQIEEIARHGARPIFTVGVGASAHACRLREISLGTGGACEWASPQESMAEQIQRHFRRIGLTRKTARTVWPIPPKRWICQQHHRTVFPGDMVQTIAWFDQEPAGQVSLLLDEVAVASQELGSGIRSATGLLTRLGAVLGRTPPVGPKGRGGINPGMGTPST